MKLSAFCATSLPGSWCSVQKTSSSYDGNLFLCAIPRLSGIWFHINSRATTFLSWSQIPTQRPCWNIKSLISSSSMTLVYEWSGQMLTAGKVHGRSGQGDKRNETQSECPSTYRCWILFECGEHISHSHCQRILTPGRSTHRLDWSSVLFPSMCTACTIHWNSCNSRLFNWFSKF